MQRHYSFVCTSCGSVYNAPAGRISCQCGASSPRQVTSERANAARRIKNPKQRIQWVRCEGRMYRKGGRWIPLMY